MTTGLDVTGSTRVMLEGDVVTFGEDDEILLQFGTTDSLFTSGLTANGTQRCELSGVEPPSKCPSLTTLLPPEPPRLETFEVSDPDNGDAALSVGDVFLLRFDRDVDRAECVPSCAGGRDFVHRLFSFSAQLATDYSGASDTLTLALALPRSRALGPALTLALPLPLPRALALTLTLALPLPLPRALALALALSPTLTRRVGHLRQPYLRRDRD